MGGGSCDHIGASRAFAIRGYGAIFLGFTLLTSMHAANVRFAIVGDYGVDDANELAVANMIKTNFQPQFVITTGDNNYGTSAGIDRMIGKYYGSFIGNYSGMFGTGASSNRFFPVIGNHDFLGDYYAAYLQYFTLPYNERYYDFAIGPVHFFMVNSDANEPDGNTASSIQANWISNRIAESKAPWKIVSLHHPPYSSSGTITSTRWPFGAWGVSLVVGGHWHNYERLNVSGLTYVVNGLGGAGRGGFGTPVAGSQVRYSANYGAMLMTGDENELVCQFFAVSNGGQLVDEFSLKQEKPQLSITRLSPGTNMVSWPTNAVGFVLETRLGLQAGEAWTTVSQPPAVQGDRCVIVAPVDGQPTYYRLRKN